VGALSIEDVLAQEADAIHGTRQEPAVRDPRADAMVQQADSRRARKDADVRSGESEDPGDVERRKAFYRSLNKLDRAALCLSGGGIRSATFSLGVIQALAKHDLSRTVQEDATLSGEEVDRSAETANQSLLSRFHYLSTVSGGGYIGSWLSAWRTRNDFQTVWRNLTGRPEGPDIEPPELSWLRAYSNYLTPKVGLGSVDTWADAAISVRNLLLNWLVIVPAIALVLLALKLIAALTIGVERIDGAWWPQALILLAGIAFLIVAQAFTTSHRPTRRALPDTPRSTQADSINQASFLSGDLLWSLLSAVLLTTFLSSNVGVALAGKLSTFAAILVGAIGGMLIFAGGWLAGNPLSWQPRDLGRWAASGAVYGGLLGLGAHLFTLLSPYTDQQSVWNILFPVILGVPWVLTAQLFAEMIFVGLVSYEANSDADREWLGRSAGWVAAVAIMWALTTFIAFAGGHFLIEVKAWLGPYIASAGGIAGIAGALMGRSVLTPAKPAEASQGFTDTVLKIGLAIAGPIFGAALVVGISVALDLLLIGDSLVQALTDRSLSTGYILLWFVIGAVATGVVAAIASRNVNINRFSLHALYRNRLIRAYLGASRQGRSPDRFTGFDEDDNLRAHDMWPPKADSQGRNTFCLFHVISITLNVVQSKRLAWQQRKAESFTVSPLHCGAAYKGFRPSDEYGGRNLPGISLGTAMAISGAAASPNMGYHSTPSISLLLALFNVRLGWWLGNPGPEGEKTYKDQGPATAIVPLAEEAFGLTTDDKPYVYLSDGGHFENLGLYEMVRRRCRFIVVVDAGCDPDFAFEDLGNALRKIFIDLGIRIHFDGLGAIRNRPVDSDMELRQAIPYSAIGTIDYESADGTEEGCANGHIVYVKPAYHGTEGAGIRSYATAHPTFPHESTSDQFFTESQFESYRSLGLDIMNSILEADRERPAGRQLKDVLAGLATTRRG
jgi:hypothetical protein